MKKFRFGDWLFVICFLIQFGLFGYTWVMEDDFGNAIIFLMLTMLAVMLWRK